MSSIGIKIPTGSGELRCRVARICGVLAFFNIGAWVWAFIAFHGDPLLLITGLLAYSFGLRHAVDADHIAAIDNVTRKLMQDGKRPVRIGFFLALGEFNEMATPAPQAGYDGACPPRCFIISRPRIAHRRVSHRRPPPSVNGYE
jgi:hypothetical protein